MHTPQLSINHSPLTIILPLPAHKIPRHAPIDQPREPGVHPHHGPHRPGDDQRAARAARQLQGSPRHVLAAQAQNAGRGEARPAADARLLAELVRHAARVEDRDRDPVPAHLPAQRLTEPAHAELAGRVQRVGGRGHQPGHGRHVDHVPGPALDHVRQGGARHLDRAQQVDAYLGFDTLDRVQVLQPAHAPETGVVEQHVDTAPAFQRDPHQVLDIVQAGYVRPDRQRLPALFPYLFRQPLQLFHPPRGQHNPVPGPPKGPRRRRTDPRRSPGNQDC